MIDLFQIAAADPCEGFGPFVSIVKFIVQFLVPIVIPIVLIIFGVVDLGKAIISSEEKEVKAAQGRLIKRCIYAVIIFFIVTLVTLVMQLVGAGGGKYKKWQDCWRNPSKAYIPVTQYQVFNR